VPVIVGNEELTGAVPRGAGRTGVVRPETAVLEPAAAVAVTATRSVAPISAATRVYLRPVPATILVHESPLLEHRRHRYVYRIGFRGDHLPGFAFRP
jgi:hypothetical protein